ncbi:MAG TPA: hypothetical protein VNQ80_01995 [Parapedobacter sp.]|uniref:hypothetical protein n=1 Tax=Parapedobacter sp. TaxID=1958893 RepID=UPI002CF9FB06|nr:hypothetical protein [Parapedobacter sp.]HWK56078.1 hypothetical protein [Parapedobacter sp.]
MRKIRACGVRTARARHARWENTGRRKAGISVPRLRKAQPIPCFSPPSLIPHPCDIRMIPIYISVKRPKDGALPKGIRQTYGKNTHSGRERIRRGSDRSHEAKMGYVSKEKAALFGAWYADCRSRHEVA